MKIGIVTIFDCENFGNQLQNYALQQVLRRYGQVVTIKNKPRFRSLGTFLRRGTPLAEWVFLNCLAGKRRKAKILAFHHRHIPTTHRCYSCGKTGQRIRGGAKCDLYCAGSDQVWNPDLGRTGGFAFLDFAGGRAVSYAASFGRDSLPESCKPQFGAWLRAIPHLSFRETGGKTLAEELTGRNDLDVHIDPTLLLSREEWEKILEKPKGNLPESYCLLYFLGENAQPRKREISQRGLPVIDLMDPKGPFYEIGPGEFLYLLSRAALVCTDSFHGSVFSFLFGRPLVIYDREGMNGRLDSFTKLFHLESCRVKAGAFPETSDYRPGYAVLEWERRKAWAYLNRVIQKEEP